MNWPSTDAEAPSATKTSEKPATKSTAGTMTLAVDRFSPESSAVVRPVMNERYAGISGSTHGERNDTRPATKAATKPTDPLTGTSVHQAFRPAEYTPLGIFAQA